jgi:hypothetical protein
MARHPQRQPVRRRDRHLVAEIGEHGIVSIR